MNHGDRVTIACKPNSDHHHPEIREKRAAMNGKTGEVVTIATLSGDVLVEADGVRSWFWASELTPAPSVEADLRATIAGLRDELANEKAAHAECERLLSEERSVRAVAVRARIEAERREDEARETIDLVVRGIPEEYRGYSRPHLCIAAMLGEFDGERRAHDKTKRLLVAAVELGRAATDVVGAWDFVASLDEPIARLRTALDAFEAPPTTAPLAQALGLLRRTRAVLHKLDPAHELLRAEIDALLAGAPVVESRRPTEDVKATLLSAVRTAHDGEQGRRDHLGRIVREEWIKWAREQPSPKPSWLVPWEGLSEPDKEVDRRIGARLYSIGVLSCDDADARAVRHRKAIRARFRALRADVRKAKDARYKSDCRYLKERERAVQLEVEHSAPVPAAEASLKTRAWIAYRTLQKVGADLRKVTWPADITRVMSAVVRAVDASRPALTEEEARKIALTSIRSLCTTADVDRVTDALLRASRVAVPQWSGLTEEEARAYDEIRAERGRQITKGRTPEKDDKRTSAEWTACLMGVLGDLTAANERRRWVKVGSVAVAAIQSLDRCASRGDVPPEVRTPSTPASDPTKGGDS